MNKVILIGNLTRDPELSTVGTGISVCKFGLAVNRPFKNKETGEQDVDFFNIVAWRNTAEKCGQYLQKGSKVSLCGRIENRTYEQDGVKKYFTDIIADEVNFLPSGQRQSADIDGEYVPPAGNQKTAIATKKASSELKPVEDEELPF